MSSSREASSTGSSSTSEILQGLKSPGTLPVQSPAATDDFELIEAPDEDYNFELIEEPEPQNKAASGIQAYSIIHDYAPKKSTIVAVQIAHRPASQATPFKTSGQSVSEAVLPTPSSTYSLQTQRSSPNLSTQQTPVWMAARQRQPVLRRRPNKHRSMTELGNLASKWSGKSFHETSVIRDSKGELKSFFKHIAADPMNPAQKTMAELEAMAVAFFRLIAPNYFPSAHVHYDNNNYDHTTGVSSRAIKDFKSLKDAPLTDDDLKNDDYVAGLAVSLVTSYVFQETDLHLQNYSKTGIRIDGDELLWPILSQFKKGSYIDIALKTPNNNTFAVTERDIINFPDIIDATPFYWPTQSKSFLGIRVSDNAYPPEIIERFKRLTNNPVFNYHKYKTFLKTLLTYPDMYRHTAELHVSPDSVMPNGRPIIDTVVDHLSKRIEYVHNVLINMPDFREFIRVDGFKAYTEILGEFKQKNSKLSKKCIDLSAILLTDKSDDPERDTRKVHEYEKRMVNLGEIDNRYNSILDACQNKSVLSFSMH